MGDFRGRAQLGEMGAVIVPVRSSEASNPASQAKASVRVSTSQKTHPKILSELTCQGCV